MSSRIEDLLTSLLNGEPVRFNPLSRSETYLKGILDGNGTEGMPNPLSRFDILLYQLVDALKSGGTVVVDDTQAYMLITPDGEEIPAVLVEEETLFTATANDIREGTVAATEGGVTVGTKEIPPYYVNRGARLIPAGRAFIIPSIPRYDYTALQAMFCDFNKSLSNSIAVYMVSIDNKVYPVNSTEALSEVTTDAETQTIDFNITNDEVSPRVLRYFSYKEEI